MTQIKLRRDTSANFTSKNPVLGIGEPAYETDTKKLKIGDGTTAYTQLEYFSAGGGSTNISATLPLKIVDGVISLEVDGQTIQIVDGKLHANLDELSNTVNTLSGDVETLLDDLYLTQADVQSNIESITNLQNALSDKQDRLNPVAPLGINQTTISNVTDGTSLTDTSVTLNSAFSINYTTSANARALIYAPGASGVGVTPTSFIQIPFTIGDLISFPFEKDSDDGIGLVFGYWKDSLFYPTMLYKTSTTYGSGSTEYVPFAFVSEAGKSSLEKIATYYGESNAVNKSRLEYHDSIPLNATNYIQVTKNAGVPTVNMWFTVAGATWPNSGYTQRMSTSDTTVLENFNKTNVCLLLSKNTSKAINLTKITRRELGDTVLSPTVDALTTALSTYSNSFDATAKVTTNDLSLAIGSGLSVVGGKLTADTVTVDAYTREQTNALLNTKQDKIVTLTKEAYDALTEKDPNTIYMIEGETQDAGGDKVTILSNEYTTISPVPTNGVWYKSPGNGYIVARFMSSTGNQFCQLAVNASGTGTLDDNSIYNQTAFSQGNNNGFTLLLPISSTQYYAVNTNFGHGLQWARFIPFITA